MRTCIGCHRKKPKRELIRIVRTPEGTVEVDPRGKRSGRGAYLCADGNCLEGALVPERLARALKCSVSAVDVKALRADIDALVAAETSQQPETSGMRV
ncbi:RNase P modulator RnpM [Chloroflexota bacterium]